MPHDALAESTSAWPLAIVRFEVTWDGAILLFEEVTDLDTDALPGRGKQGRVTLKKGLIHGVGRFRDWYDRIKMSTVSRKPMTIRLVDAGGATAVTWTLDRAWPARIAGTSLDGEDEEPVIDELVVVHEGLTFAAS